MKRIINEILSLIKITKGNNLTVIILCVVAATIFWFFNALNKQYSTNLRYPINFVFDTDRYIPVNKLPEEIQMNVDGVGWNLLRKSLGLRTEPINIRLSEPLETTKIAGSSIPGLITDQVTDLKLNYVITDTLFIDIDRKISKSFHLKVDSSAINLDRGYTITSPLRLSIDSVILTGPRRYIESLGNKIYLYPDEEEIDDDFEENINIRIPNQNLIQRNPPTVILNFQVAELLEKQLELPINKSILQQILPVEVSLSDSTSTILISFPDNQPEPKVEDFKLITPLDSYNVSDSTVQPKLTLKPDYVRVISIDTLRRKIIFPEQ